jgi:predicted transcriptional regulator of viral defense system
MKPSRKQQAVLRSAKTNGFVTLKEAVRLVGGDVYANTEKHTGAILSNMVKRGMLIRVKPGTFKLPEQEQTLKLT